jgi:hypothetical protein
MGAALGISLLMSLQWQLALLVILGWILVELYDLTSNNGSWKD